MQTLKTITFFGTVSNAAISRTSKNGRHYTAFGVSILDTKRQQTFHYNVVAFGKQGQFASKLQKGTRIKLAIQAQSQPDNIATIPLLTATFVRPVRPAAVA
jgi:single-stranded DNA-binding protein